MKPITVCLLVFLFMNPPQGRSQTGPLKGTTLGDKTLSYKVVESMPVAIQVGNLSAMLVGNQGFGTVHRPGYNGLTQLRMGKSPSPFVESYAGLNLEHVNNGVRYEDKDLQFEPRKHPMEVRKVADDVYELYQKPLPNTGLESCTRFHFQADGVVDVIFECVPRKDHFPYGYLNLFWASYIQAPADNAIYFLGRKKGTTGEDWIKGVTPKHGVLSTHRQATDRRNFRREEPFPLTLVFNESDWEYTRSFYYGRYADHFLAMLFHPKDNIRFTQSPSGGGSGNPAWDFQWFIDSPKKDKLYSLGFRTVWGPWTNPADIQSRYQKFLSTP
ncbi:MAG: hypothetical protein WCO91_03230 [Gemmataceae bacterium]